MLFYRDSIEMRACGSHRSFYIASDLRLVICFRDRLGNLGCWMAIKIGFGFYFRFEFELRTWCNFCQTRVVVFNVCHNDLCSWWMLCMLCVVWVLFCFFFLWYKRTKWLPCDDITTQFSNFAPQICIWIVLSCCGIWCHDYRCNSSICFISSFRYVISRKSKISVA